MLNEQKNVQRKNRLLSGEDWNNSDYIFTQANSNPLHPDTITAWFKKFMLSHSDLPYVSIHSLRHTNATLLIANGVNLTTVSKRLGHANTSTTTKIYVHAIKTADELASDTLENILNLSSTMNK